MIIDIYVSQINPSAPGATDGQIHMNIQSTSPADTTTVRAFTINNGSTFQNNGFGNFRAYTGLGAGLYVCYVRMQPVGDPVPSFSNPYYITLVDGSEPPDPDAMVYKDYYHGEFCDKNGDTINIDIKRHLRAGDPDPDVTDIIFGGEEPVAIDYKDEGEYKQVPVIGSECTIKVKAVNGFELSSLYTESETEWMVLITGGWEWVGFVIPDSCSEPYAFEPYDIEISATDRTGTLKDAPFQNPDLTNIALTFTDQEVLRQALQRTGLDLSMIIACNTREASMNTFGDNGCPLRKVYINTQAFIDEDEQPSSCYEVIRSICVRWSSRLFQWNGKWHFVNVLEQSKGAIDSTEFNSDGDYVGALTIGNEVTAGGEDRTVQAVGTRSIAKALKSSTVYYKYGYKKNDLYNGNFDQWTSKPSGLPDGWSSVGGLTMTTGIRQDGGVDTTDYFLNIGNNNSTGYAFNSTPVQVRANEKATLSFDYLSLPAASSVLQSIYTRVIIHDVTNDRYFTPTGWQNAPGGGAFRTYNIRKIYSDFLSQLTASIEINAQDADYQVTFGIMAITNEGSGIFPLSVNNVTIAQGVTNAVIKPGIGIEYKIRSRRPINYTRDNIEITHNDEPLDTQRTSGIIISGTGGSATMGENWGVADTSPVFPLLYVIASSELTNHGRPYYIFEGIFFNAYRESLGMLSLLDLDLISGQFLPLSGTFYLKEGNHKMKYAETLLEAPSSYSPEQKEVYEK